MVKISFASKVRNAREIDFQAVEKRNEKGVTKVTLEYLSRTENNSNYISLKRTWSFLWTCGKHLLIDNCLSRSTNVISI